MTTHSIHWGICFVLSNLFFLLQQHVIHELFNTIKKKNLCRSATKAVHTFQDCDNITSHESFAFLRVSFCQNNWVWVPLG